MSLVKQVVVDVHEEEEAEEEGEVLEGTEHIDIHCNTILTTTHRFRSIGSSKARTAAVALAGGVVWYNAGKIARKINNGSSSMYYPPYNRHYYFGNRYYSSRETVCYNCSMLITLCISKVYFLSEF